MKYKTTKKAVNEGYKNKICVTYCGLQNLLCYENEVAYITRREGWACDIYEINGSTAIITGYAPFGNIRPAYETIRKYDLAAEKIRYDYSLSYEDRKIKLDQLIKEFVEEVTKQ